MEDKSPQLADSDGDARARFRRAFQAQNAIGRTTESIAHELGMNASTLRNYANGSKLPPVDRWPELAAALHESQSYFLYGETPSTAVQRLELLETVTELKATINELAELLAPLLTGERTPVDQPALQQLGRALGRKPQTDNQAPSP